MAGPDNARPRAWQRMLSGRRLDLLNPSPLDIELDDIAHGLARVARWNGQTEGDHAFSVAQHSLVVERIAASLRKDLPANWRLAALLHDAPEYVIGDLISPFKAAVGLDYKTFEDRLLQAIHVHFGLPGELPKGVARLIKRADRTAAFFEATRLAGFGDGEARRFFGSPRGIDEKLRRALDRIEPMSTGEAQLHYLERVRKLEQVAGILNHSDVAISRQDQAKT